MKSLSTKSSSAIKAIILTTAIFAQTAFSPAVEAQERAYPARVVRIVTPLGVGAGADGMLRTVAEQLTRRLNQPFIVESKPGAAGMLAAEFVANAPPDGHTLLLSALAANAINMSYFKTVNFDLRRDFMPISKFATIANGIFVGPGTPANTLAELTAMAKAAPGKMSCASSGTGGLLHLTCEMYKKAAGIDLLHVPYKSSMIFLPEITVGSVTMVLDNIPVYVPMVRGGKMKALAVTTTARSPVLPDVPTAVESGLPTMDSRALFALFAPAATRPEIVQLLNREVVAILNDAVLKDRMLQQGIEIESSTPDALREIVNQEIAKWARVIKEAGIRPE